LLFTGVRGTGKTSSARILAKVLRCPNLDAELRPCGHCPDCVEIAESRSNSVIEIDGASNNGVDSVRELRESVRYAPISGRWKIYIIDEVHMLSTAAFNALLKTLEEPPPNVVFVLATTEVQKIPATILGRCQRFDFRRIPTRLIHQHLVRICEQEGLRAESEALWMLARQADGSMRDGQSLLDQCAAYGNGELTLRGVSDAIGLTDRSLVLETLTAILGRDGPGLLGLLQRLSTSSVEPRRFAQEVLEEIRHTLMARLAPDQATELIDLPESEIGALVELSQTTNDSELHLLFDLALKGANDIARSSDPHLVLEILLLRLVQAPRLVAIDTIQLPSGGANTGTSPKSPSPAGSQQSGATSAALRPKLESKPSPSVAVPAGTGPSAEVANGASVESSAGEYTLASFVRSATTGQAVDRLSSDEPEPTSEDQLQGDATAAEPVPATPARPTDPWSVFVDSMKETNGLLAAMLDNTSVLEQGEKKIVIGVPAKMQFFVDKLRSPENIKKIEEALNAHWKKSLQVEIRLISSEATAVAKPGQSSVQVTSNSPAGASSAESSRTVAATPPSSPRDQREEAEALQKKDVEERAIQNPLVQSAQSVFKTKVKSIQDISKGARQ
jgi:DNA polymerase-3 subunit gamma/tau